VNRISHGDLKPDNILVKKGVLKIADFGFAAFRDKAQVVDKRGTPYYMAPEVIQVKMGSKDAKPYNVFKADIYSYSMILYCIFRGIEVPFPEFSAWAPFASAILSGYRPKLDTDW
jgi:serine/threonine protein kinase